MIKEMQEHFEDLKAEAEVYKTWVSHLDALICGVEKRLQDTQLRVRAEVSIGDVKGYDRTWISWRIPNDSNDWHVSFTCGQENWLQERWLCLPLAPVRIRVAAAAHLGELVEHCLANLQELNGELQTQLQSVLDEAESITEEKEST
jgi:hypothetical protein